MPIGLSPKRKIPLYLASDVEDEPDESKRPVFYTRHPTCEAILEFAELAEEREKAVGEKNLSLVNAVLNRMLALRIDSWDRLGREVDRDGLYKLLTLDEKVELIGAAVAAVQLGVREKKASDSSQPSDTVASAGSAEMPSAA